VTEIANEIIDVTAPETDRPDEKVLYTQLDQAVL
jgi:hypothetical protein